MTSDERLRELEEKYEGYKVYDNRGEKIGKVDDLFIDEADREEYIGVKMGFFGLKSTLIPMDLARVNETDRTIEVAESKERIKDAPTFSDDDEITPDYEHRIRDHFGLESAGSSGRGSYGAYSGGAATAGAAGAAAAGTDRDRDTGDDRDEGTGYRDDRDDRGETAEVERAGVDADYGERSDQPYAEPTREGEERLQDNRYERGEETGSAGAVGGYADRTGDSDEARSREDYGSESGERGSTGLFSGEGETREMPTSGRTEETETVQEGGRTRVRRRVIREEIIEEPDEGR